MDIASKVVVITGGSSGLGKAMAALFVKKGANVVISSHLKQELDAAAREVGAVGIMADVTREEEMMRLAEETIKQFDRIDIWINNAGIWMPHASVESMDLAKVRKLFDVNVFGVMHGSRAALRQMRKQGNGAIVNIISISALEGRPYSSGYCASKFAADGFTKSLRIEAEKDQVQVLAVYPGRMKTPLFDVGRPQDFDTFMAPETVAAAIIANLEHAKPATELVVD